MCPAIRSFPAAGSAGRHLWNPAKNRGGLAGAPEASPDVYGKEPVIG